MAEKPVIYVLNGPNLNLLGTREPDIYGSDTLDDIAGQLEDQAQALGVTVDVRQSNHEGHLIDWLHEAQASGATAVLLNAGAYTHTSIAIHDAIKAITVPVIEVHLSNPHRRDAFRHKSFVGEAVALDKLVHLEPAQTAVEAGARLLGREALQLLDGRRQRMDRIRKFVAAALEPRIDFFRIELIPKLLGPKLDALRHRAAEAKAAEKGVVEGEHGP